MAKTQATSPEAFLQSILSAEVINAEARAVGFRKRNGKIQAAAREPELGGFLRGFRDVVAVDSTVVKVRDELTSAKPHIVRTQVMAALLRASLSMMSKRQAEAQRPADRWINPMAWTQVWTLTFDRLLQRHFAAYLKQGATSWKALAAMTQDPELRRPRRGTG